MRSKPPSIRCTAGRKAAPTSRSRSSSRTAPRSRSRNRGSIQSLRGQRAHHQSRHHMGGRQMLFKSMIASIALATAVIAGPVAAQQPFDESKYPAFAGQWQRIGPLGVFDQTKPPGRGQQAPLTPEYQKIFEANLAEVAKGGFGDDPVYNCIPEGMPRAMTLVLPMEIVITPNTTYIMMEYLSML